MQPSLEVYLQSDFRTWLQDDFYSNGTIFRNNL